MVYRVEDWVKLTDEMARLNQLKEQMTEYFLSLGEDKIMADDGIHYIRRYNAVEPKWVEEKITPAHFDNGRKAYVRYY